MSDITPAPLWDMSLSADMRHALTHHNAPKDEYGIPLYGYAPDERLSKACCDWRTFIQGFAECWKDKFHTDPHPEIVKQARTLWKRWSMTGYEAFHTLLQKARMA